MVVIVGFPGKKHDVISIEVKYYFPAGKNYLFRVK